jgi:hypothetical protein
MGVKEGPFCRVCVGPTVSHQNFLDFSKSLENSKNTPDYREYSKYCEYRINFSNLWR